MTASGMVAARNQSLMDANGRDVANPTSSISSVPSTVATTSGSSSKPTPWLISGTTTATNSEISTSRISFADRYSQNRRGVEMTAPRVRSCFSKNTVPATKKNPMMQGSPNRMEGSATGRRRREGGNSTASQISPENPGASGTPSPT